MKRIAALLALAPLPALAHHPMGGATPSTLFEAFASGIGHPVIGLDHLAFLLAAGVLAATLPTGRGVLAVLAFVVGGFLGSLAHVAGIGFGPVEALVAIACVWPDTKAEMVAAWSSKRFTSTPGAPSAMLTTMEVTSAGGAANAANAATVSPAPSLVSSDEVAASSQMLSPSRTA